MNRFYPTIIILVMISIFGCDACKPLNANTEVGNGNDNPELLVVKTWGTEVKNAALVSFYISCVQYDAFFANVDITTRTASLDATTNELVVDNQAYFEAEFENVQFFQNDGIGNDETTFNVDVPETGAYQLTVIIQIIDCTQCCIGTFPQQCGIIINNGLSDSGFPVLEYSRIFSSANRPAFNFDHAFFSTSIEALPCDCSCQL